MLKSCTRPARAVVALVAAFVTLIGLGATVPAQAAPSQGNVSGSAAAGLGAAGASTAVARSRVAADVLMQSYDPDQAWFPSSWWNSAVALQTVGDYMQRTGDRRYLGQLDHTFVLDQGAFPAGVLSGDPLLGNFTSRAIDDSEWWGLTWVQAYDLTGQRKYLDMAVKIATYVQGYWDTGSCGGGVWWNAEKTYKNAVTNGLYIRLTAELHNRIHGDRLWLGRAEQGYHWFTHSGLINSAGLVNDGLTDQCANNGQTVWSYNQGLAIGGALELYRATHDPAQLVLAKKLADAALAAPSLVDDGILTESCDALSTTCDDNGKQFKGVFLRYLDDLATTTHTVRYQRFVGAQAASVWGRDRDAGNRLGERWSGATDQTHPNAFDWRTQASALSALIAAVPAKAPSRSLSATLSPAQPVVMPSSGRPTTVRLRLAAAATSPRWIPVVAHATMSVPKGWSASPTTSDGVLWGRGNAAPVSLSTEVQVRVPADATNGHHLVRATVTSWSGLTFTATADVLVARTADFDTGTPAETPWLFDADGSQSNGPQSRFADGDHQFVYRFPLPADTTTAKVDLTIDAEYLVQASPDDQAWTTVLVEKKRVTDGSNKTTVTLDLTPELSKAKVVYLRVADSFPDDGWGGRLYHLSTHTT